MKTNDLFGVLVCLSLSGASLIPAGAQAPSFTSFTPDGLVTWTNVSTNDVVVVESLSPATSGAWMSVYAELPTAQVSQAQLVATNEQAWFRLVHADGGPAPTNMVWIPSGSFQMGDSLGDGSSDELPVHTVYVSGFYMDRYEVTNDEMVRVMQWAYDHGRVSASATTVSNLQGNRQGLLDLGAAGSRITWDGAAFQFKEPKAAGYPCVEVTWYGAAAYCNFRSEMEGRTPCYDLSYWSCDWSAAGYRLPTEAEWEYAARGGMSGQRFPWGSTISHAQANYVASTSFSYDLSSGGHHPDYDDGGTVGTSPVGAFSDNGYGLYDMAGNVLEWCWDWYGSYPSGSVTDPRGPTSGSDRMVRGGGWYNLANYCRVTDRIYSSPGSSRGGSGFRAVLPPGQ